MKPGMRRRTYTRAFPWTVDALSTTPSNKPSHLPRTPFEFLPRTKSVRCVVREAYEPRVPLVSRVGRPYVDVRNMRLRLLSRA